MEFGILGPLRVSSGDETIPLGAPAQRELLAVLLTAPNAPIPADRLVDELWGDDPPPTAHHLVQVYVSRLRQLLDGPSDAPRIAYGARGYALRVGHGELDAERFVEAVATGRAVADRDPESADRILAGAMRLWRGTAFAGLAGVPWSVRERIEDLERRRLEALEAWNDVRLRLGRHRELVPDLAALVAQQPYDETAHAQLMLALYRSRRQSEALRVGRALQDRLREDLAIDASAAVRDLYRDILLQAPHLDLDPPDAPTNVPDRLTSFVGRSREMREVAALLAPSRLVTLTGPGGIGKTRLAIEVARTVRSRYPDGTWWIDLAPVSQPEVVVDQLAAVLGVAAPPGADLVASIARALGRRRTLLLVDNCEHVVSALRGPLAVILGATRSVSVLATSRRPLRIEGELLWTVPPMQLPPPEADVAELSRSDAVRLFVERGRAADASFVLRDHDVPDVVAICRRLDGISLAIEMAAARLPVLGPREIVGHLDRRFALLELPTAAPLGRHRTLEAAFDASYVLLSEPERAAFERLGVFAGPFDLDAAAAVGLTGASGPDGGLVEVTALVEASLVSPEREGDVTRYRLLETVREYALARLRARGSEHEHDARRAHAAHFIDLAAQAGAAVGTPAFAPWVARLVGSYPELRQALAWSLEHEPRARTLRAVPALMELWYRTGNGAEAGRWAARMLVGDREAVSPTLVAQAHLAASFGAIIVGDLGGARDEVDEAGRLARACGDARTLSLALWARAQIAFAAGDLASMRADSMTALEVCDRSGDRLGRAKPLTSLASAAIFSGGSPAEIRRWLEEALPLLRELGDMGGLVLQVLTPLSDMARRQGDLEAAECYASEAVETARGSGWQAAALAFYSEALMARGDLAGAEAAALRGLRVALDAGLENWFRIALRNLAVVSIEQGRPEAAAMLGGASRRDMPAYGLDPVAYARIEDACRAMLPPERVDRLTAEGRAMSHDELMELATRSES